MTAASLPPRPATDRRNRRTGLIMFGFALAMLGLGYASVPLYRLFCQVTGFGGTTQRVDVAQAGRVAVTARTVTIRFDGNVARDLAWTFGPEQVSQDVKIGERTLAFFKARNDSAVPITGVASFNVAPERAGKYFNKVHCFCFNQQTLQPGQTVDMPVQYFVDPAILKDEEARGIEEITLSYTFHRSVDQTAAKALDRGNPAG